LVNEAPYKRRIKGAFFPLYPLKPFTSSPVRSTKKTTDLDELLLKRNPQGELCSIYVHIPFCDSFCSFCAIPKVFQTNNHAEAYLNALKKEISEYAATPYIHTTKFGSLYFGGGTPTALHEEQLVDIINCCKDAFDMSANAEITVEGCTHNYDKRKLAKTKNAGVNRVSFGVQTFNDSIRRLLNLKDTKQEVMSRINLAHQIGFTNVDIDLMYNLPNQTVDAFVADVLTAINLGIESISFFALHVEPHTKLQADIHADKLSIGNPKLEVAMYRKAVELLTKAGYVQESIIAKFTLPSSKCIYEQLRVSPVDCLALGPSSNGNLGNFVYRNTGETQSYLKMIDKNVRPITEIIELSPQEEMRRYLTRGLALQKIDKKDFQRRFTVSPEEAFPEIIQRLLKQGLIVVTEDAVQLTDLGAEWGQNVCIEFCSDEWKQSLQRF
jgi:putative oxygen-independent coproporphyrinogen III oxidase